MPKLYFKIKNQYIQIDYNSTLKLLVRARIAAQIKQDATIVICRYQDFIFKRDNVQQLRDELVSDELI